MTKSRLVILITIKKTFNKFLAVKKETSVIEIFFSIVSLIDKLNRFEDLYYKLGDELREFDDERVQPKSRVRELSEADNRRPTDDSDRRKKQRNKHERISKKPRFLSR